MTIDEHENLPDDVAMTNKDPWEYSIWSFCAWTAVLSLGLVSSVASITANHVVGGLEALNLREFSVFTRIFSKGFVGAYLLPSIPALVMIVAVFRGCGSNQFRVITVTTLCFGLLFLCGFLCSMLLFLSA